MVKRYTQPCVQTQPGPEFKIAEVELFEDRKGKWVRHDDVLSTLQALIDQLAHNHEWRSGAVLAYNAFSCSQSDAATESK